MCETPFPQTPTPTGVSPHSDPGDVSSFDAANAQSTKLPFAAFTSSFLLCFIKKLGWGDEKRRASLLWTDQTGPKVVCY